MKIYYIQTAQKLLTLILLVSLSAQAQYATETSKNPATLSSTAEWFRSMYSSGDLQIHGFASQSFITTSDNDVFGNSDDDGSFGFTEIGLNALLRPLPRLQISAQGLSRRAGKGNSGVPRLDFAFADYRLFSQDTNQFGIRAGRLKNPFGFYNDTRDVPFTRPSILLPQSIYFDRVRNLGLSSDSVQFYGETSHSKFGRFSAQFGISRPIVDDRDTTATFIRDQAGSLSPDVTLIGRGIYESSDNRFRLALSGIWLNMDYDPGIDDKLDPGSIQFTPLFLSAQYNAERWSLTSEYALRPIKFRNFNNPRFDSVDETGESFYLQGVYRISSKWEALLRYDVLFTDRKDRNGKEWAAKSRDPAHSRFAKDLTVGLRWNVTPEFMLRAEYHRVDGTAWLSPLDNQDINKTSRHWNLFAIQASYRF